MVGVTSLAATLAASAAAAPSFSQTEVWGLNEDEYAAHFVYSIGVTWNETLLVACEGRVGSVSDTAEKDLLLKRSTDGGATWSDDQVIEGATDTKSWSNPAFVTDGVTTYLFYADNDENHSSKVYYRSSTDNGATWSERTEITDLWAGNAHEWTFHLPIGHGIKKVKNPDEGRVILPMWHRRSISYAVAERRYGNDVIYLDNGVWKRGGQPAVDASRSVNETRIAERANGEIVMISRQAAGSVQKRARTASMDSGETWGTWVTQADINGTPTDSGLLQFSDAYQLYTFPDSDSNSSSVRNTLTIKASTNGGINWGDDKVIHAGQATYSDLTRDGRGNIYCIYGRDGTSFCGERVYVAKFNLEWVIGSDKPTILIDNGDSGFATAGTWSGSSAAAGYYGANYEHDGAAGTSSDYATWTPAITVAGDYAIYMRWTAHPNRPDAAPVRIDYTGGSSTAHLTVNQQVDGATWRYLGTYHLTAGSGNQVRITDGDAGYTVADAVMFQKQ